MIKYYRAITVPEPGNTLGKPAKSQEKKVSTFLPSPDTSVFDTTCLCGYNESTETEWLCRGKGGGVGWGGEPLHVSRTYIIPKGEERKCA